MSSKSIFLALENAGGSWLWFSILILIWKWSVVFSTPIFKILALYLVLEGAKNKHVLLVLIWGFEECWRFLTGVWHLDHDLDIANGFWYTHVTNFGPLSWYWRCNVYPCPFSPDLGHWRTLQVPDWGLASWSWFRYGHWCLVHPLPVF